MAQVKQVFIANDGKEFGTEAEADAHDVALAAADSIKSYVTGAGLKKAQATLVSKHIAAYLGAQSAVQGDLPL